MYFTRLELITIIGIGAIFIFLGLFTLASGRSETATTMLLAGLAVLGVYLWVARSEA